MALHSQKSPRRIRNVYPCLVFSDRRARLSRSHRQGHRLCSVLYLAATELVSVVQKTGHVTLFFPLVMEGQYDTKHSLGAIGRDTACAGCISGGWKYQFNVKNTKNSSEVSEFFTLNCSFYPPTFNTPTSVRKYTTGKNTARAYARHVHRTGAVSTKKNNRSLHPF